MKIYIKWLVLLSFVLAFGVRFSNLEDSDQISKLKIVANNDLTLGTFEDGVYSIFKNNKPFGYLSFGSSQGYGGPLKMAVLTNLNGGIIETQLVQDYETVSFLGRLDSKKFDKQFLSKKANNRFELISDIAAVSGATVSSEAITLSVREAAHRIAEKSLEMQLPTYIQVWEFGLKEVSISLLFVFGVVGVLLRKRKWRYVSLFFGIVLIGFMFNASLSITHFGRLFLGYFPDIHTHYLWWLLIGGTLTVIIIWGKNVYCTVLCPFLATQVLLNKISGIKLKLPKKITKPLSKTPTVLLWASLIIVIVSGNPTVSSYEPFALLFSLEGVGVQWYIMPAALIGSMFVSNFFCRFFCPVGGAFKYVQKLRKIVLEYLPVTSK